MKDLVRAFSFSLFALLLCLGLGCEQQEAEVVEDAMEDSLQLNRIPPVVLDVLNTRFPNAEIRRWTREEEGDVVVYDIEFEREGRKFEADIKEDGTIHNWEREIALDALPQSVKKAVETEYPISVIKEIMEIEAVSEGKDVLEGYEVVLETTDMREVEITVAPDGTILEDSGEESVDVR